MESWLHTIPGPRQIRPDHSFLYWLQKQPIILQQRCHQQHFAEKNHPLLEDNWLLQRLGGVTQLGQVQHLSAGACQTRQVHSLDSAALTSTHLTYLARAAPHLEELWDAIVMHAVLHDAGHYPYSHVLEDLLKPRTGKDHKQLGIEMLDRPGPNGQIMSSELEKHGIDPKIVKALMAGAHPAAAIVADKTLGAEKIAYLLRDREHDPGYARIPPPDIILDHLQYQNDTLGLTSPGIHAMDRWCTTYDTHQLALDLNEFFARQYAIIYLSPQSLLVSRHAQRMAIAMLENGTTPEQLWSMNDSELEANAGKTGSSAKEECALLRDHALTPPRLVLKREGYGRNKFRTETAHEINDTIAEATNYLRSPDALSRLEDELGKKWGTPVVITACPAPERFSVHPTVFFDKGSTYTLADAVPDYDAVTKQIMRRHWSVRVHANAELPRQAANDLVERVLEYAV